MGERTPVASSAQLSIERVARAFPAPRGKGTIDALAPITLEVASNDFLTILGPSGCGKSTLLRIVAGLDTPTSGRVLLDGRPILGPGPDRGMVFQSYTLFPWLTVRDNICFGLRERGLPLAAQHERAAFFIERVGLKGFEHHYPKQLSGGMQQRTALESCFGLKGFEHHYPKQLSGGMQQRTALARALANDPAILLLDEPFGALDNQTRALMQELLLGIWEQDRKTVLFVTHDVDEAIFMANRVIVFTARPGRIKTEVGIDLPHPRHYTVKTTPRFAEYKATLTEAIREEVLATLSFEH